jgi:hypothetical protein
VDELFGIIGFAAKARHCFASADNSGAIMIEATRTDLTYINSQLTKGY